MSLSLPHKVINEEACPLHKKHFERLNASLSCANLQDPAGVPEKILYLPAGRQGGNLNLSANCKNGLNGVEAVS
jgi:hypothetical protein